MDKVLGIKVQVYFSNKDKGIRQGRVSGTFKNEDEVINILRAMSFPASQHQVFSPNSLYEYEILKKYEKVGPDGQAKLF